MTVSFYCSPNAGLQLLSWNLCNSSFQISRLLTVSFFYLFVLLPNSLPSNTPCSNPACCNTWPIRLCLWHHIVFNIFLSSWTIFRISSFIFINNYQNTETCQCRMMVHTRPRVNFEFPSTMSSLLIFTSFVWTTNQKTNNSVTDFNYIQPQRSFLTANQPQF